MTSKRFDRLFGGPPRAPETPLTQREMDLAASIQKVTEEIMLRAARHLHQRTGMKNLCLAGGVALNCVGNGRILREGPFERIWIQPAAGDAGGALGAALFIWYQLLGNARSTQEPDAQRGSLLGPRFSADEISCLPRRRRRGLPPLRRRGRPRPRDRRSASRRSRWWAGSRGGWSSGPAPSAAAPSSATPAAARCSR